MASPALPDSLLSSLRGVEGFDEDAFRATHEKGEAVTSVRFNPLKTNLAADHFPAATPVPWCENGYYLHERPSFILDPWLHGGAYYVQEASGMFLSHCLSKLIDRSQAVKALDLCAAPGGKSTLMQSALSEHSLLVSNEVIKPRAGILVENIVKWGGANRVVTSNDARDFAALAGFFDLVMIDAPCSGSGLFRKDPDAILEWSPEAVMMCSARQKRILADILPALKEDGIVIYSTCSYSREENEDICDWLCDTQSLTPVAVDPERSWHITETHSRKHAAPGYRFFPDRNKGEGFFIACFRKRMSAPESPAPRKPTLTFLSAKERAIAATWIRPDNGCAQIDFRDQVVIFPETLVADVQRLVQTLFVRTAGIACGKIIRDELIPEHELAVSTMAAPTINAVDLNLGEALTYLRKQEPKITPPARGWAIVRYDGIHLGWIKMLGNRINNYYPKEWRILKTGNN